MTDRTTICGMAYQRAATVELDGATLRWRAGRGNVYVSEEAIDVPLDELRRVSLGSTRSTSITWIGATVLSFGVLAGLTSPVFGAPFAAIGAGLVGLRWWRPRWSLVLATPRRTLVLHVARGSLDEARRFVAAHGRDVGPLPTATATRM